MQWPMSCWNHTYKYRRLMKYSSHRLDSVAFSREQPLPAAMQKFYITSICEVIYITLIC